MLYAFSAPVLLSKTAYTRSTCLRSPPNAIIRQYRLPSVSMRVSSDAALPNLTTDDCDTSATQDLTEWCISRGVKMPKLQIIHSKHGRSLQATADISPSEALLLIPSDLLLKVDANPNAPPPNLPHISPQEKSWENAPWEIRLAVVLLNELRAGISSPWHPYICTLPKHPSSALVALTDHTRAPLARTQLANLGLLAEADAYAAHVLQHHAAIDARIPITDFCWAVSVAQSRAFGVPGPDGELPREFALFPALDCGNHSARVRCELHADGDAYVVMAGFGVQRDNEVYLNYGEKTPEQLALFYGFVEGGSPDASVEVGPEVLWDAQDDDEDEELRGRKQRLLERLGVTGEDIDYRLSLLAVDDRLMMALRVAFATGDELDVIEKMEGKRFRAVGLENEMKVWKCVEQICERLVIEVGDMEAAFLKALERKSPFSVACCWGDLENGKAEALLRFERNRVLSATIERVKHFSTVSAKIGMVCTVLMPPTQSIVKADLFGNVGGGSGVHHFTVDGL